MNNMKEIMSLLKMHQNCIAELNLKNSFKKYEKDIKALLEKASDLYYNTDERIIDDQTYDDLYKMYRKYTNQTIIGAAPRTNQVDVDHEFIDLVGTLDKVNNLKETKEWLKGIFGDKEVEVVITWKYDGNSVVETMHDGECTMGLTRGRDGKGKDVTALLKAIPRTFPKEMKGDFGIKYEIIMTYKNFEQYLKDTEKDYKNPRSVVGGIFSMDDGVKYAKYLTAVPLWIRKKGQRISRFDEIQLMEQYIPDNINMNNMYQSVGTLDEVMSDIEWLYNDLQQKRVSDSMECMIDGIVIEVLDQGLRDKLGYTNDSKDIPKFAIALKFPYMEKTSEVERIEFWLSKNGTGIITPVCYYKPVHFIGATHEKQSLQNYKRFKELNLGVGSPITVQFRNDVLTYIEPLATDKIIEPIPFIDHCPECNGDVEIVVNEFGEETYVKCGNPLCPSKMEGQIMNWINKLDLKGIGAAYVHMMFEKGVVTSIPDLYSCSEKDMALAVNSEIMAKKFKKAINDKLDVFDYELIGGLGIDEISRDTAKLIFKVMTFDEFIDIYNAGELKTKLISINGIGDKTIKYLEEGLTVREDMISELLEHINIKNFKDTIKTASKVYTFVVTGKLNNFTRDSVKEYIETRGYKLVGSVTSKTDYLVNNDINSVSGKNKKAKELGIPIITEEELIKILE